MIGSFLKDEASQYRHIHRERVGSTNTDLLEFAKQGDPGNLWLTAGEQLAGKGSRGRDWVSVSGNLYASLLLVEPSPVAHFHELTFVAAIAARNALERASAGSNRYQVKWPNDLLCNGKKCVGILLESGQILKTRYVIIGMGFNVAVFPENTTHTATSLRHENVDITPEQLFAVLSREMAKAVHQWDQGNGFSSVMNDWRAHAFGLGEQVSVNFPNGENETGRFASIDDHGYMVLEKANGDQRKISTADIFFVDSKKEE